MACPFVDQFDGGLLPIGNDAVRAVPPLGLYQLAAVTRAAGHDVQVADLTAEGVTELADSRLEAIDVLALSATTLSWPLARRVAMQARRAQPGITIVAGGVHPTMFDHWVLARSPVDYVVRGEAERSLVDLLASLERGPDPGRLGPVAGLSWRDRGGRLVRNPVAPKIGADVLASMPAAAWDLLTPGAYRGLAVETSRGCAFDCSFCSTPYRRSWRALSPAAVVDRFEALAPMLELTTERSVYIVDDEFTLQPARTVAIVRELDDRRIRPRILFEGRAPDLTDDALLDAITPHTLQFLVGAECGYDEGLARIGKGTTCAVLEACAAALARREIAPRADFSFILGLPWETPAEARRTVAFAVRLGETYGVRVLFNWYAQIPGSRLWDDARAAELVHESQYDDVGFLRDLSLFRSGVALRPSEIWAISDEIADHAARLGGRWRNRVEFAVPPAVGQWFPREGAPGGDGSALARLRELARPTVPVGVPQRRIHDADR